MADHPILFSGAMIRALLDGRKTQTRRLAVKNGKPSRWQRVKPEDRLWVRETWQTTQFSKPVYRADACDQTGARWHSIQPGDPDGDVRWRSAIHMPRWASRLSLVVTERRIEPLHAISEDDARAEGYEPEDCTPQAWFMFLWAGLHRIDSWNTNPEVVALTFTVHHRNIDSMEAAA